MVLLEEWLMHEIKSEIPRKKTDLPDVDLQVTNFSS